MHKDHRSKIEDGVALGLVAFKQYLVYGNFKGKCSLIDKKGKTFELDIPESYGFVEYVYSRW